MNELIKKFHNQAIEELDPNTVVGSFSEAVVQRVAELIVRECINQAHSVGDLRGTNDDMIYGADTAAVKISKHFGVEE